MPRAVFDAEFGKKKEGFLNCISSAEVLITSAAVPSCCIWLCETGILYRPFLSFYKVHIHFPFIFS
jgi:hypothetical protein